MEISIKNGSEDVFVPVPVSNLESLIQIITRKDYSLSTFNGNKRNNKSFNTAHFIGLDFDTGLSLHDAINRFNQYTSIIIPTRSHQKEKNGNGIVCDRFRVIIQLSEPIKSKATFKSTVKKLLLENPEADRSCSDPARQFFASPHPPAFVNLNGKSYSPVEAPNELDVALSVSTELKGRLTSQTTHFCLWGAQAGNWNQALYTAALDFKSQGYTFNEAVKTLSLATRKELGNDGELDDSDLGTINSAYNADVLHEKRGAIKVFDFQKVGELSKNQEKIPWLVNGLLTEGGISIIAGPPKSGKSTIIRQLSLSVATGTPFLNRNCKQGRVLYLALEEQKSMLVDQLRKLGLEDHHDFYIHVGPVNSANKIAALKEFAIDQRPSMVVIDTLLLFMDGKDVNSYNEMYTTLSQLREISRESGAHIVLVHHTNKGDKGGASSIMGSNAIHGSVDCAMIFVQSGQLRLITSSQRGGEPFNAQPLEFNKDKQSYELGEKVEF